MAAGAAPPGRRPGGARIFRAAIARLTAGKLSRHRDILPAPGVPSSARRAISGRRNMRLAHGRSPAAALPGCRGAGASSRRG